MPSLPFSCVARGNGLLQVQLCFLAFEVRRKREQAACCLSVALRAHGFQWTLAFLARREVPRPQNVDMRLFQKR